MMFMIVNYCSDLGMVVVAGLRFVSYVICVFRHFSAVGVVQGQACNVLWLMMLGECALVTPSSPRVPSADCSTSVDCSVWSRASS